MDEKTREHCLTPSIQGSSRPQTRPRGWRPAHVSSAAPSRGSPASWTTCKGWRSATGESIPEPITLDDGVWPVEFQNPDFYTRAGSIGQWGLAGWEDPMSANVEFRRGDFFDLKDLNLDDGELAIRALANVFQYWIALTDCDGFRVDAVKPSN